jgi:hypothetical protein
MSKDLGALLKAGVIAAMAAALFATTAEAAPAGVDTPADTIHPNIHQNLTNQTGANANPNNVSPTNGGNLHGIGNTPGQADINPNDDGVAGFANQLQTVHGGIGAYNKNALPLRWSQRIGQAVKVYSTV